MLLLTGKSQTQMILYSLKDFRKIKVINAFAENKFQIRATFCGPSHLFLCVGSDDGRLLICNKNNENHKKVIPMHASCINYLDYDSHRQYLLTASDDKTVKIWCQ